MTITRKNTLSGGDLILNSPYDAPRMHWLYDRPARIFTKTPGRRPAGYVTATPGAAAGNDPGRFVELPLVNQIRERVNAWRTAGYENVTGTTRKLLEHWQNPDLREGRRFFFCQMEAIETLIWLTEASPDKRQGIEIPGDGGPFSRWCSKLATGSGKTIVMAMLIAWQTLNKATYPADGRFGKNFLILAPGLTVRNRLEVLIPDSTDNYFDLFQIVPPGLYDTLRQGRVLVRNWHKLDWESDAQIARRRSVDKRGAKSDEAYVRGVLGEMATARNLIVINDEAHHAWRVPSESKIRRMAKTDVEEATKWVGGLDRIHKARAIQQCFDFSATPFAPSGKRSDEEALFEWIVSDFGLNDAIESGLVKTPRVVIRDNSQLTAEYRSRLYHLYRDDTVHAELNRSAEPGEGLPDLVRAAYELLGEDWKRAAEAWRNNRYPVPPVMITVANRVETAARVKYAFDHKRIDVPELCDPDRILHIDSKVLGQAELAEETPDLSLPVDSDEDEEAAVAPRMTKQQQAELLRRTVDTVGQVGKPGEKIHNIISVGMLSEGWDAKTVTHIMGLRAFSSQLLCEQVVGRGLRRTTYEIGKDGKFPPEYVNIFGVPFTFLPHEEDTGSEPPPPQPGALVELVRHREAEFGIEWPNVVRIEHVLRPELTLDLAAVKPLELKAGDTPTHAELAAILEGKPNLAQVSEIDLEKLKRNQRMQTIIFKMAVETWERFPPEWPGGRETLLPQIIRLVERVIASDRIRITPPLFNTDPVRRRILILLNMNRIVQHLWQSIRFSNTERLVPVFDPERPIQRTANMRPWWTRRPTQPTVKSHVNLAVFDSTWEASESYRLEHSPLVQAWVKNDHLGFEIQYLLHGVLRKYRPDFLARLTDGSMIVLEVKGQKSEEAETKRRALEEWTAAVGQHGEFGRWRAAVSYEIGDVEEALAGPIGAK